METTTLICKRCKAPLEYEEGSSALRCPHCGYTELINESDQVTVARILAKNNKDTELGLKEIEKAAATEAKRLHVEEKRISLKKTKLIIAILILACLAALVGYIGIRNKHKSEVKIPLAAEEYCGRDFHDTHRLLEDAGFENIEDIEFASLTKNELENIEKVAQVSINGNTSFSAKTYFPKTALVKILYYVMDPERIADVQIPNSSDSYSQKNYMDVVKEFKYEGFTNITLIPKYDITFFESSKNNVIESITINGQSAFQGGVWMPSDSKVRVSYHSKPLELIGTDYHNAVDILKQMGFMDFDCIGMQDLDKKDQKKAGSVESVMIGDLPIDEATELDLTSHVTISFHSERVATSSQVSVSAASKDLVGKNYKDGVEALEAMGFANVRSEALNDIANDWYNPKSWVYKDGDISAVSIDGTTKFSEGDIFDKNATVIVSYHSNKE